MHSAPQNHQNRPIRVLHLTISFERGGRRDAIHTLARSTRPLGITSTLATLRGTQSDIAPFAEHFDSTAILGIHALPSLQQVRDLRRRCRDMQIDLVHAHDAASQYVASVLRLAAPAPHTIMTFHRSLGFESDSRKAKFRNAATLLLTSRVLTASEERRRHFLKQNWISPAKVVTIPLGIDLDRFRPNPDARAAIRAELGLGANELLLVSAGHFGPEKGLDQSIRAVAAAARAQPGTPFRYAVLGTGSPDRVEHITRLGSESLGGQITFRGQVVDPERWFAAADILIHSPQVEAFGLVVVQAMASGTVPLAAAVGGIPELIVPDESGILVPAGDSNAMGAMLATLLVDRERLRTLSEGAVLRAHEAYGAEVMARRHAELYREVVRSDINGN